MRKFFAFFTVYFIFTFFIYGQDADSKLVIRDFRKNSIKTDFIRSVLYRVNVEYERFLVPQISIGATYCFFHSSYGSKPIRILGNKEELFLRFYTNKKKQPGPYFQLQGGMIYYQKEYTDIYNTYRVETDGSQWLYKYQEVTYKQKSATYTAGFTTGVHKLMGEKKRLSVDYQWSFQVVGYPFHKEKTVDIYNHIDYMGNIIYTEIKETSDHDGKHKFKWYASLPGAALGSSIKIGYAF